MSEPEQKTSEETATEETTTESPAEEEKTTTSLLGTLAERGEEAFKRSLRELNDNPRMQDARDRLGKMQHTALNQLNIASLEEVETLRKDVAALEQRLAALEEAASRRGRSTTRADSET
jgi:ubiquinone biosynthesis protein UbiJ